MEKVIFSWSGGKDCALALREILADQNYCVIALLTTVTEDYDRISMHGVRRELLEKQAESLGLPLEIVYIPKNSSNEVYESRLEKSLVKYKELGIIGVVFGDIYLEDLRQYREKNLARLDLKGIFPLWKNETSELMNNLITLGFEAVTVCVDTSMLSASFVGRKIDQEFIAELPNTVDKCGENGEYHSFVFDGPIFKLPIPIRLGERVLRDERFFYCDLVLDRAEEYSH